MRPAMFPLAIRGDGRPKPKYQHICEPDCLLKLLNTSWHSRVDSHESGQQLPWKGACIGIVGLAAAVVFPVAPLGQITEYGVCDAGFF